MDSLVLLHLCHQWQMQDTSRQIRAVYVNHNLHDQALAWQRFCSDFCEQHGIAFQHLSIELCATHRQGLEDTARRLRYQALFAQLSVDEVLLTAHHQNDQAETFLLNALRQSGVRGLGAMQAVQKKQAHWHLRPLLNTAKKQLIAYAALHDLCWIEDESNHDIQYRRNWLRHTILPQLAKQQPAAIQNLAATSVHLQEADHLLNKLAQLQLRAGDATPLYLRRDPLLEWAEQKNVLRYWLTQCSAYSSRLNKTVLDWLAIYWQPEITGSAQLQLGRGRSLRIFQQRLYLLTEMPPSLQQTYDFAWLSGQPQIDVADTHVWHWHLPKPFNPDNAQILSLAYIQQNHADWYQINKKALKRFFQSSQIPPWERDLWPVIQYKDSLSIYPLGLARAKNHSQIACESVLSLNQIQCWRLCGLLKDSL
ncbi:tRNA(Ile)-lysidine synthase [Thiosulfatimonas sediminis]|uniref:tRNA(Ile)-lysidine synthase n=2 Tax=Thiosulfatimonas sediminis TaxID=2675054 RepID=A0A6F8PV85_9GAMM|nr:tRNA(Ile)-lysidine synthase [Thiosulfatimonas sediminis]